MSRWADWFAITPAQVEWVFAASCADENPDDAVMDLLEPMMRNRARRRLHLQMDKAWEPIHKCLTGDRGGYYEVDFDAGKHPLNLVVAGGEPLLVGGHRWAGLIDHETEVPALAAALAGVKKAWFRKRFFALPATQFHGIDDQEFDWAWAHFEDLPPFFAAAAAKGKGVVCTISL
jgi:hypothetical protein